MCTNRRRWQLMHELKKFWQEWSPVPFEDQNPMVGCGKARNFKSSPPRRQERQEERSDPDI